MDEFKHFIGKKLDSFGKIFRSRPATSRNKKKDTSSFPQKENIQSKDIEDGEGLQWRNVNKGLTSLPLKQKKTKSWLMGASSLIQTLTTGNWANSPINADDKSRCKITARVHTSGNFSLRFPFQDKRCKVSAKK